MYDGHAVNLSGMIGKTVMRIACVIGINGLSSRSEYGIFL